MTSERQARQRVWRVTGLLRALYLYTAPLHNEVTYAGPGVRTSSRAVAGGGKAGKSSPDPTDLFTNRVSNHCALVEARIFDKKHAIFLFAQPRHDRGSEG